MTLVINYLHVPLSPFCQVDPNFILNTKACTYGGIPILFSPKTFAYAEPVHSIFHCMSWSK